MSSIKSRLVKYIGSIGGYKYCRFVTRTTPKILMYHRFSGKPKSGYIHRVAFEQQVAYLTKNFNLFTMGELISIYEKQGFFPKNAVVITVDDGYRDFYDIAFPVLKAYHAPATFYVTTRFVDGNFWLWPDAVKYILDHSVEIDLGKMPGNLVYPVKIINDNDRRLLWNIFVHYLLSITEDEKVRWIKKIAEQQGVRLPDRPTEDYCAASWSQIKELDAGNIEIGAHTQTHPSLSKINDTQLSVEVDESVNILRNHLGHIPPSFCFPNGQPSDYTELVKRQVKAAGCKSAVTAFFDRNIAGDLFELRRYSAGDDWQEFAKSVNGIKQLLAKWTGANSVIDV